MNKYFLLIFWVIFVNSAFSQKLKNDSIKIFIDKSIELIQSNSIHTENIASIKQEVYDKSQNFQLLDSVAPMYARVFELLKDHHGNLAYNGKSYGWQKVPSFRNAYLKEKLSHEKSVVSSVVDESVGYLRIPGNNDFAFKKVDSIANDIASHINKVNSEKIKGWILDLRLNTGGNMYPILLGLKEFIGEDIVFGGFRNAKNESTGEWAVKDGTMLIDGIELVRATSLALPLNNDISIVILTSCYTASAGEMTAISLIGRMDTYIVGEPTAGYTTAVQGFEINESAGINLSTDFVVDRNLNVYKDRIEPNFEVLLGDNLENLQDDKKIVQALKLLKK